MRISISTVIVDVHFSVVFHLPILVTIRSTIAERADRALLVCAVEGPDLSDFGLEMVSFQAACNCVEKLGLPGIAIADQVGDCENALTFGRIWDLQFILESANEARLIIEGRRGQEMRGKINPGLWRWRRLWWCGWWRLLLLSL